MNIPGKSFIYVRNVELPHFHTCLNFFLNIIGLKNVSLIIPDIHYKRAQKKFRRPTECETYPIFTPNYLIFFRK